MQSLAVLQPLLGLSHPAMPTAGPATVHAAYLFMLCRLGIRMNSVTPLDAQNQPKKPQPQNGRKTAAQEGSSQKEAIHGDTLGLSMHTASSEPLKSCTHPPPW
jgi:hypothetical protein